MGFWLLAPFFLIRFGLLSALDRGAVLRAAHFPPLVRGERLAYWVYQISNAAILLCILCSRVRFAPLGLFAAGAALYGLGTLLLLLSVADFAAPSQGGMSQRGLYRFSRNPMYVAYFLLFAGCALLVQSPVLPAFVLIFQTAAHWIIRAEERWCAERFGEAYLQYRKRVRRYF